MEAFFLGLPLPVNILFIAAALYVVIRASHSLVDGAVNIAHEFRINPLVIGATVVAMGTSSAELAVNLVIVAAGGDASAVVGNILGSNLVNFGIELGVSALIAGLIIVSRGAFEKDIPLYFAATGLLTALAVDGQITRMDALLLLAAFLVAVGLLVQSARRTYRKNVLLVEMTEIEAIAHPAALDLTRGQALLALFGGLAALVLASRFLILNTTALALALEIPEFVVGLAIIGPGTSLPEIASSIQAARRGHADLVLGTAFGSNLFNLLFGLGFPALIRPLPIGETAFSSLLFLNIVNMSLLALLLLDFDWMGRARTINRVIGGYLVVTYVGFMAFQIVTAFGGSFSGWLEPGLLVVLAVGVLLIGSRWVRRLRVPRTGPGGRGEARATIVCATRGGSASRPTHAKAIELALEQDAELVFLYVFDTRKLRGVATPIVVNVDTQMEQMRSFLRRTAQAEAKRAGVKTRVIVRAGSLVEKLMSVAAAEDAHLIVVGSPVGERSLIERDALQALAADIGVETLFVDKSGNLVS